MNVLGDKKVKPKFDSYLKIKIMQMLEKLQSIRNFRISSFYSHNAEQIPMKIKNLPESLLGSYLNPKFKKKEKIKNISLQINPIRSPERGSIEFVFPKQKTLITSISQINMVMSPNNKSVTREYITTENKKNLCNIYDPFANNSLKRKHLIRNLSKSEINTNIVFN